jgi:uncharacterized Zn finger protein
MPNIHLECDSCGAVYNLHHDLEKDYYKVVCCPFCGEAQSDEHQDEIIENDE